MNIEVARQRYRDVFLPDVIDNSQGDFLAKHVPMKNLLLLDYAEPTERDKQQFKTEEEIYEQIFDDKEDDQFILVKGASGAGKSHLIRWFDSMLQIHKKDNEIVLYIRRADNTLKGTIKQLIELDEIKNLPNHDLYKKLASASTTIPELELKNTIYYGFINLIDSDDGKAGDEERIISNVDRKHLLTLLQNSTFKEKLMKEDGPIDRIYNKIAENKSLEINEQVAEFKFKDLAINSEFMNNLISGGCDAKAQKIARKMLADEKIVNVIVRYVNKFRERVIQRCTGLEPGDLRKVIEEIRQELYKENKTLTILIEDITAASGVDDSLLDALLTNKRGYTDKKLCRINSIVGVADGYYRDNFRTNTKGRIKKFIIVPDEMFNGDTDGLIEFFARYLNTVSLDKGTIEEWLKNKALADQYPVHKVTLGKDWDEFKLGEKSINLFPFTKNAIVYLYGEQDITQRNPRAIMRNIIEPYVKDSIESLNHYPVRKTTLVNINPKLQTKIYNRNDLEDETKIRLTQFMYIWGNGSDDIYEENGIKYIAGIAESIYKELELPILDGEIVAKAKKPKHIEQKIFPNVTKPIDNHIEKENEQVSIALKEVDQWIENKDYLLNIGATTQNVKPLTDVRKNINDFLYDVIDWVSEGVSIDAVLKIKETKSLFLVAFERQTKESKAVVLLPASIESRRIIEAFLRWNEIGEKSWDFPNGTDFLYRVQYWIEGIKPKIIESILYYENKKVDYFSFATAAEYYRLILNGDCKKYQSPFNLSPDLLLSKNTVKNVNNRHTKAWNDLLNKFDGIDGIDGDDIRNCVLQYYNLPQGNTKSSKNYEYDYINFKNAVKKVTKTGLSFKESDLQLDDPVKKRRLYSDRLKKILDRIPIVVKKEKEEIEKKLMIINQLIEMDKVDDEDDISYIIKQIGEFYDSANKIHIGAVVKMDYTLINVCKKNVETIYKSINNAKQALECDGDVESLLCLSKDPLSGLTEFANLLEKTNSDLSKVKLEIEKRMRKELENTRSDENLGYKAEKDKLNKCRSILEEIS